MVNVILFSALFGIFLLSFATAFTSTILYLIYSRRLMRLVKTKYPSKWKKMAEIAFSMFLTLSVIKNMKIMSSFLNELESIKDKEVSKLRVKTEKLFVISIFSFTLFLASFLLIFLLFFPVLYN